MFTSKGEKYLHSLSASRAEPTAKRPFPSTKPNFRCEQRAFYTLFILSMYTLFIRLRKTARLMNEAFSGRSAVLGSFMQSQASSMSRDSS